MDQAFLRDNPVRQTCWDITAERLLEQHQAANGLGLAGVSLIGSQHLLPSIMPLFEYLFKLGLNPKRTYLLAKEYSTREEVYLALQKSGVRIVMAKGRRPGEFETSLYAASRKLWKIALPAIGAEGAILLDHGGFLRSAAPQRISTPIVAIEHTTKGTFYRPDRYFPCIDMARSELKNTLEPQKIAEGILRGLKQEFARRHPGIIGVIGLGAIGGAIARLLLESNYSVLVFDADLSKLKAFPCECTYSAKEIFEQADLVIGCTGRDISEPINKGGIKDNCSLISASSGDTEFAQLLSSHARSLRSDGSDYLLRIRKNTELRIIQRGFPINLAMKGAELRFEEIALTRALTLGCILQAARLLKQQLYLAVEQDTQAAIREYLGPKNSAEVSSATSSAKEPVRWLQSSALRSANSS